MYVNVGDQHGELKLAKSSIPDGFIWLIRLTTLLQDQLDGAVDIEFSEYVKPIKQ